MTVKIPQRFRWAAERLPVTPASRLLEVGCGNGVFAKLVLDWLGTGTLDAIDRSAKALSLAKQRNAEAIQAGRLLLHETDLANADFGRRRFDVIFAFNVNVFWIEPSRELAVVRRFLKRGGALHLFYDPLSTERAKITEEKLLTQLAISEFAVRRTTVDRVAGGLVMETIAVPE